MSPVTRSIAEIATLAHGYTMADVDKFAQLAARQGSRVGGLLDERARYDAAWEGVVTLLYGAEGGRPAPWQLVEAGSAAITTQALDGAAAPDASEEIAHGFTSGDIARAARVGASRAKAGSLLPTEDRAYAAWFGAAQFLLRATIPTTFWDLQQAAQRAVEAEANQMVSANGLAHDKDRGIERKPQFRKYWDPYMNTNGEGDFADRLVNRLALPQVLALLSDEEYQALAALAAAGKAATAAQALGVPVSTFNHRLGQARRTIEELWHQHETPHRARPSATRCGSGHPRADFGWKNDRGSWRCRVCDRNSMRRRKARGDVASQPGAHAPGAYADWVAAGRPEAEFDQAEAAEGLLTFAPASPATDLACWCGLRFGHDWPLKSDGAPHPRA